MYSSYCTKEQGFLHFLAKLLNYLFNIYGLSSRIAHPVSLNQHNKFLDFNFQIFFNTSWKRKIKIVLSYNDAFRDIVFWRLFAVSVCDCWIKLEILIYMKSKNSRIVAYKFWRQSEPQAMNPDFHFLFS